MQFTVLDILIVVVCVAGPAVLFLKNYFRKKANTFQLLETAYNLPNIQDLTQLCNDSGHIIKIDKVYLNNQVVEVGIQLPNTTGNLQQDVMNLNQHYKFYQSYLDKRWDMAIVIAGSLRSAWNGQLKTYYDRMIARCNHDKRNPPPLQWTGVFYKIQ